MAETDGLFAAAGAWLARLPLRPRLLYPAALGLVALVTAVLNLDTAVFFLTPVLYVVIAAISERIRRPERLVEATPSALSAHG